MDNDDKDANVCIRNDKKHISKAVMSHAVNKGDDDLDSPERNTVSFKSNRCENNTRLIFNFNDMKDSLSIFDGDD